MTEKMAGSQLLARLLDGDSSLARELAQLLDLHSIISMTDVAGRITFVNDKFCEISGYSEEELLGQNHRILKSENHPDTFYKDMWDRISQGETWHGVICNHRKDHNNYWVESTIKPLLDHKGKLSGYLSARTDITTFIINDDRLTRSQKFANIGTWDWNIQTGNLYWSDRIAPLFGYNDEIPETTYENFIAAVHPDDRQKVIEAINNCVANAAEYNLEHRVIWQDGSIHWLHERGDIVRSKDGSPLHMLGVVRDITNRKAAQLALQESEHRLTEAQTIAGIGNWSWQVASGNLYWSDEIYRIFGYQPGEFEPTYERFMASVHPDDLESIKQSEQNAFSRGEKHSIDHRIVMPDGLIRWVHEEAEVKLDTQGKPIYLQGTVQDITQRKYTEQLQKGRSQILEEVLLDKPLESILGTMILHAEEMQPGMTGSVLLLNDTGQYLMHASAPNLPDYYNEAIHGLKIGAAAGSCGACAFTGQQVIVENIQTHPYWVDFREVAEKAGLKACWSQPIISSSGKVLGAFAMYYSTPRIPDESDLALATELAQFAAIAIEQSRARHKLIEAKNEAEKANKAKSQFLSSMSHELRTPLNAIIGFSQLLQMNPDNINKDQLGNIHEIHHAGLHLLDLINEVLDLARIEAGNMNLSIEGVYLDDIINECLPMTMTMAVQRGIKLLLLLEDQELNIKNIPRSGVKIHADKTRLKQVLLNLLSNAVKYNSDNGSITIDCKTIDPDKFRISITDTGLGLDSQQQEKLFQPFNRLGAESSDIEGTGIGLVITKNLIKLMNGSIGIQSKPGKGSTFWIDLPLDHSIDKSDKNIEDNYNEKIKADTEHNHSILYIEDNPSNLRLMAQLLRQRSHIKLIDALEPAIGIKLAIQEKPDLILLDINLPGMNGYEVLEQLKKNKDTNDIPVIAVSANAMPQDIIKGEAAGFNDYITKPINTTTLLETIDTYLKK